MGRQRVLAPPALALALALAVLCVLAADARPHLNLQPRAKAVNNRPIIGIMTQPVDGTPWAPYGTSAMNADYVKFLEAAGARVVPVPFDADQATLDHLFDSINGLLYPGGGDILNGTQYFYSCQHMFNRAVQENKAGGYFPLWGTCLGFQFLSAVVYGGVGCLSHVDAENISLPLSLSAYAPQSRLWSHADLRDTYLAYLSSAPVTENYHHWGVLTSTFSGNPALASFYNPIATSRDREGVEFIAAMEAKNYPFYAVQYHPERSLYEWDPTEQVDHSGATVAVMQYHARFFVSEARKSSHSFADPTEELNTLIYNYSPIYSWKLFQDDMQLYVFNGTLPVTERDVLVLEARARF